MRKNALIALAVVAIAVAASIYAVPALAHPYWADEPEEEFIPPCLADEDFEPGEYGPGPYGNQTCPWRQDVEDGQSSGFNPPWYDPENGAPGRYYPEHGRGGSWGLGSGFRRGGMGYRRGGQCHQRSP